MQRLQRILVGVALGVTVAVATASVPAAQDKSAIVKERQEAMKQLGDHMKAINAFVESGTGSADDVATRAASIQEVAEKIPDLFPEGTSMEDDVGKTGAKPVIWTQWEEFQSAAQKLADEAAQLASAAADGNQEAIAGRFASLGKNGCGGCHTTFRQKLD